MLRKKLLIQSLFILLLIVGCDKQIHKDIIEILPEGINNIDSTKILLDTLLNKSFINNHDQLINSAKQIYRNKLGTVKNNKIGIEQKIETH
jgi:hypothetical protein